MDFASILLIAFSLAMDAFAVSLGIGTTRQAGSPRAVFRLSFHFGLFQFLMPIVGWFAGVTIESYISRFDHWVAAGLLWFVGGRMILAGLKMEAKAFTTDPSRGFTLIALCLATSLDALAVGLSLAMIHINILYPSLVIGVVTGALSVIGLLIGHRLGTRFGKRMEVIGGVILVVIGVRILAAHLG